MSSFADLLSHLPLTHEQLIGQSMRESQLESLRQSFRPERVKVLFIGESRPRGGTFFFAGNSNLAHYTQEAFERLYGPFADTSAFLKRFSALGCYLVDLCSEPVNGFTLLERSTACRAGESTLARAITREQPRAIVVVKMSLKPFVMRAIAQAGMRHEPTMLPFPSFGHQRRYVDALARVLRKLRAKGVIS
jgi:hypothetical protein